MKTVKLFTLVAVCLFSTAVSAQSKAHRLYSIVEGDLSVLNQHQKMEINQTPYSTLSYSSSKQLILRNEFQWALGLGLGYEFKDTGISRVQLRCGLSHSSVDYDYDYSFYEIDQDGGKLAAQLDLVWLSHVSKQLKWVPSIGIGYGYEWVGNGETGYNSREEYICISPIAAEYWASDRLQFQLAFLEAGFFRIDTEGVSNIYYTFLLNLNKISTKVIFRF